MDFLGREQAPAKTLRLKVHGWRRPNSLMCTESLSHARQCWGTEDSNQPPKPELTPRVCFWDPEI